MDIKWAFLFLANWIYRRLNVINVYAVDFTWLTVSCVLPQNWNDYRA